MKSITIQPKQTDKALPYPYHIDGNGLVERQEFWRGKPKKLIGFSPIKAQKFHEKQIDLKIFIKNPKKAIGMYPIFEHEDCEWYTYQNKIESIRVN